MAVYTKLEKADIEGFLADYDVRELREFNGIAEGVSNTNYLLHTASFQNYILTLFEKNFDATELPFFMELTTHLANKGIPCPRPICNSFGGVIGKIKGKPAVLIEFLRKNDSLATITEQHLKLLGEMVARLHLAAQDFSQERANSLSLVGFEKLVSGFHDRADEIAKGLSRELETELAYLEKNFPQNLPVGIVHTDIFPDNVFFTTSPLQISGIIDFYFSCFDFWMYDLMIVLNAWCFNAANEFMPERARALLSAYNSVRPISEQEKAAMPILARAASMRFLLTRTYDWLNPVGGALVNRKDPMEYMGKLKFHQQIASWRDYGWEL